MPCLQRSVQSRKGGIRGTKEGERLYFLVFLVTYTILYGNGHPIHLKWPQYRSCCTPIVFFLQLSSCTCIDSSSPQIFITRLFRPIHHFNTMDTCPIAIMHIPIYHNRAVLCRVARLLQPCWLGTVRHGFDRVYTSNFNRTVPCRGVAYRAGTEKIVSCKRGIIRPSLLARIRR